MKDKTSFYKILKKGKYNIPGTFIGVNGATKYIVEFPIDMKYLKKNSHYYADYHLIIECDNNIWHKILKSLK